VIVHRDERRGPASSFAEVADEYERSRPGYPDDAVSWLAGSVPLDVVDLGAGTGKLTRSLVALEHRVVAVDPLSEMLGQLHRAVPEAVVAVGSAEEIPVPDRSADVVTCAQAFHWFDPDTALPEIARILRPGGLVALVWNVRDNRESWVAALSEVIGSENIAETDAQALLRQSPLFGEPEQACFAHVQRLDRATLHDLVLSRSYCAVRTVEQRAPVLAAVDGIFDEYADGETIELPYLTECFRAQRL
jgi:SAM-dependent methyltransferase